MSQWFDQSNNANKLRQSYLKGFLDISFNLSVFSFVKIDLYNAAGMLMQSLLNEDIKSVGLQKRSFKLKEVAFYNYCCTSRDLISKCNYLVLICLFYC